MNPIEKLTVAFEKFPGIGPRQARRFVQYLLSERQSARSDLADAIKKLGAETALCKKCFRWFVKNGNPDLCAICASTNRDASLLFVVEKEADIETVEKSRFRGLYFVLSGTIPLAAEEIEKYIRVRELVARVESDATSGILKELILGLSATTEGDHTRLILQEKIRPAADGLNFKITSLGRGLSTGSELEYADPETIANALSSRN
jgi:recombination protein RecR